jgi:YHS domain-containing protein
MTNPTSIILGTCTLALTLLAAPMTRAADGGDTAKPAPKPYPLTTCLISGEKLGEMGDPYVINHKGQEIKFCCKGCVKDFNKDPDAYLKKLKKDQKEADAHQGHDHGGH